MTQTDKELLLKDLCSRLPYGVKVQDIYYNSLEPAPIWLIDINAQNVRMFADEGYQSIEYIKPYLFPMSSMTDEDYAIYSKIWEDTGKTAYLEGCHHLISTIKAYKAANDYLISKHYDINGLIPMGLAEDTTGLNIY
jgi:hypothetical protein